MGILEERDLRPVRGDQAAAGQSTVIAGNVATEAGACRRALADAGADAVKVGHRCKGPSVPTRIIFGNRCSAVVGDFECSEGPVWNRYSGNS
jgi:hypothetical protein